MKVFGKDPGERAPEDAMGHIIIGDIYGRDVSDRVFGVTSSGESSQEPPPTKPPSSPLRTAALLAAMAAVGGGLATIPWLVTGRNDTPVVEPTDTDTRNRYDIEKYVPRADSDG